MQNAVRLSSDLLRSVGSTFVTGGESLIQNSDVICNQPVAGQTRDKEQAEGIRPAPQ